MIDLGRHLRPGDGLVWSQGCAQPSGLLDALFAQLDELPTLRAFCGLTLALPAPVAALRRVEMLSYGALGALAELSRAGGLQIVPCHYSALPRLFATRRLPGDVALVQVSPAGPDGRHSLGLCVDYVADAITHARVVVAEVNEAMPATVGGPSLAPESFAAVLHTSRPLLESPSSRPGPVERAIAEHVAGLVRDGDTIQIGVGVLPEAILAALAGHRDLGLHSGIVSDGVLDLIEGGAMTGARKEIDAGMAVAGIALGTARLFSGVRDGLPVAFRPTSYTHAPAVLSRLRGLVAINSAVEVDLAGQVNAEVIDGDYVGAVGGQSDFCGAASGSGALSVIALPSTARGRSRIVPRLRRSLVSTAKSDVDCVVTEHGVADLRGLSFTARAAALARVAAPPFRDELAAWSADCPGGGFSLTE